MSNKVNKDRYNKEQEQKEEKVETQNEEQKEESQQEQEKVEPAPEEEKKGDEKSLPLTKKERWFAAHADQMDDIADKVVSIGKWVIGGALLIGAGMLIHKGLSDDSDTIDIDAKVNDIPVTPVAENADDTAESIT